MHLLAGKVTRSEDKVLSLVARAKPTALPEVGYVEERGRRAIKARQGIVEIFYPTQETKKTVRFSGRKFVATKVEIVPGSKSS